MIWLRLCRFMELGIRVGVLAYLSLSVLPTKIRGVSCFSDVQLQELQRVLLCRGISLLSRVVPGGAESAVVIACSTASISENPLPPKEAVHF